MAFSIRLIAASIAFLASADAAVLPERATTQADQQAVAVTIYNQDLALVKDTRQVTLERKLNRLAWRDVAAQMRPETALLRNLTEPGGFFLLEQNFDFDLLTPQKLLEKSVGRTVTVIRPPHPVSGVEERETATVLATNNGVVLKFADRVETGIPGRLAFSQVPENLRAEPTLTIAFNNGQAGVQTLELSYLTGGLSWKADYVAELSKNDDRLDLSGWVTLANRSGTAYPNAKLQLVAGDVNRVQEEFRLAKAMRAAPMVADAAPQMKEEGLFEYHLYTLDRPTTIADNQTKQVALLSASQVPVRKEFLLRGADYYYSTSVGDLGQKVKVGVFVEFQNKDGSLGIPLPKGVIRMYKKDSAGNAQFIGEDRIDHTPKNEKVRLKLGDAFDLTADKKQTEFQKLAGTSRFNYIYEAGFQFTIKNAKSEPVVVRVQEPVPGDWQMVSESHPHRKEASGTAVWDIKVPADGQTTLNYRVRVRY